MKPYTIRRVENKLNWPSIEASRIWIHANAHQYRKQWVAVENGILLGSALALEDVLTVIAGMDRTNILITKVLEQEEIRDD